MPATDEPSRSDDALAVPALFLGGSALFVGASLRAMGRCVGLLAQRSATLAQLARESMTDDEAAATARRVLRDELLGLMREAGEIASQESRAGVDDFDTMTREWMPGPDEPADRRQQRVKS